MGQLQWANYHMDNYLSWTVLLSLNVWIFKLHVPPYNINTYPYIQYSHM